MIIKIDASVLEQLALESKQKVRRRTIRNYHQYAADPFQRMLNAMQPDTYVQPHKHDNPDKREVFVVLQGKAVVVTFTDDGKITDHVVLNKEIGNFVAEIPAKIWHTVICLEKNTVLVEFKDGPYDPNADKHFAGWAPAEGEQDTERYKQEVLNQLNL